MVNKAGSGMDNQEVFADDSSLAIYMINDGIAADFLADERCMDENEQGLGTEIKFIRDHSFIHCLKGLSLSEIQKAAIIKYLGEYKACTQHSIERAKAIYSELCEKYNVMYRELWSALQKGSITKDVFQKKVNALKADFKKELRAMHLKEKLDDAFKACLRTFFKALHGTLSEHQWNVFVACARQ